ncbi:MAG TPA: antibiotic biosynthesis monooxygenase [Mycobacteriales bacterium]
MIVLSRFRPADGDAFRARAEPALAAFAARPGFVRGHVGRAADDPALWTIVTEWDSVGSFRRALSAFDVKVHAAPLLAESIEEPSAYEVLLAAEGTVVSVRPSALAADAGTVRVGEPPRDRPQT